MFKECVEFCGEAQPHCRHYQGHFALNYSAWIFLVLPGLHAEQLIHTMTLQLANTNAVLQFTKI